MKTFERYLNEEEEKVDVAQELVNGLEDWFSGVSVYDYRDHVFIKHPSFSKDREFVWYNIEDVILKHIIDEEDVPEEFLDDEGKMVDYERFWDWAKDSNVYIDYWFDLFGDFVDQYIDLPSTKLQKRYLDADKDSYVKFVSHVLGEIETGKNDHFLPNMIKELQELVILYNPSVMNKIKNLDKGLAKKYGDEKVVGDSGLL